MSGESPEVLFGTLGGGNFTIATIAMLMSVLIIKLTKKPVKDRRYSTTRAGTASAVAESK